MPRARNARSTTRSSAARSSDDQRRTLVELEVLPGLEPLAIDELSALGPWPAARVAGPGRLRVTAVSAGAALALLESLRTIVSVNVVETFDVPRPKALLGDAAFRRLVEAVRGATSGRRFTGLRVAAAGATSPVMQRLGSELAGSLGLRLDPEDGDLVVRMVRGERGSGWEAIVRTTPRPVSTRAWRRVNMPGSLNGSIAAAMVRLARPHRDEPALNLLCGAGTIAIEHLLARPASHAFGVDIDARTALRAAVENARAAGVADRLSLVRSDVQACAVRTGAATLLYADLPYGDKVSSQAENEVLYPAVLGEAARQAHPDARFVVITHDVRRFERHLAAAHRWRVDHQLRVFQSGHRPGIWLLRPTRP